MAKRRVGASLLLKNGYCWQSYGWNCLRPLGDLQRAVNSLEAYRVDEIAIIRPVRATDTADELAADVAVLRRLQCLTPISFGGGIRSVELLQQAQQIPVERLVLSSAFIHANVPLLQQISHILGRQALQALLPLRWFEQQVQVFCSSTGSYIPLADLDLPFIASSANEIIVHDTQAEGHLQPFNVQLLAPFSHMSDKLILSGGVNQALLAQSQVKSVAAVLIENRLLHSEYSVAGYRA